MTQRQPEHCEHDFRWHGKCYVQPGFWKWIVQCNKCGLIKLDPDNPDCLSPHDTRYRPAPAPQFTNDKCGSEKCMAIINAHREEAATQAREDFVKKLSDQIELTYSKSGVMNVCDLLEWIKSLRGAQR